MPATPPKLPTAVPNKHGCWFWGLIAAAALLTTTLVVVVVVTIFGWKTINSLVANEPVPVAQTELSWNVQEQARVKIERLLDALEAGRRETFVFSADELNAAVDAAAAQSDQQDSARFEIENGQVKADVSLPLGDFRILGFQGGYLNAVLVFDGAYRSGHLDFFVRSVETKGNESGNAAGLLRSLTNINLGELLMAHKNIRKNLEVFEEFRFVDDTAVVVTGGAGNAL